MEILDEPFFGFLFFLRKFFYFRENKLKNENKTGFME